MRKTKYILNAIAAFALAFFFSQCEQKNETAAESAAPVAGSRCFAGFGIPPAGTDGHAAKNERTFSRRPADVYTKTNGRLQENERTFGRKVLRPKLC